MARKTPEQLDKIKKKLNVDRLWSWSRVNTYLNSSYEYFLKYIKKEKETRQTIYGLSGSACHDCLESFYNNEINYEDMIEEYETALINFNLSDLKYDRTDEEKNERIANKYESCIKHFFQNHNVIPYKIALEKFITINVHGFVFQGYVDAVWVDDEKVYNITDWKTSSIYKGKKIDSEKGQLLLYAEGLIQKGVPIEKIKPQWAFLKYVDITFTQKNGKEKTMTAERHNWVEKISSKLKMNFKDLEWEESHYEPLIEQAIQVNHIENLPKNIQDLYKVEDCYVEAPFDQEEIDELKKKLYDTIVEIHKKEKEYEDAGDHEVWWEEISDENSYYFANLCGYNANQHLPYKAYLDQLNLFVEDSEYNYDKKATEETEDWMKELGL